MVQSSKASDAERQLQGYSDELGIRRHAERLEATFGADRAIEVLEEIVRRIAARRTAVPSPALKPIRK